MAKNNKNKGFSLIEIVIAIAILSILLTPIIKQFSSTMRMNRISKEQQAANENAQYVLEYFRSTDLEALDSKDATKDIYLTGNIVKTERKATDGKGCAIYLLTGDESSYAISTDAIATVDYNVYEYDLNHIEVGSRNTVYTRTVYMDDLAARLMDTTVSNGTEEIKGLRVAYNLPTSVSNNDDFVLTNEGSYVKYDASGKFITAIVCVDNEQRNKNPNEINMGNVQNLDAEGAAVVSGYSADFDNQAHSELYAKAMERLRLDTATVPGSNLTKWEIEMSTPGGRGYIYDSDYISNLRKMTVVNVEAKNDGHDYYDVSVDVYYEAVYSGGHDTLKYTAYSQKFYYDDTKDVPEIYLEYQPFVVDSKLKMIDPTSTTEDVEHVEYAQEEYILINSSVEDVKIYLYKPRWDFAHRYMSGTKEDATYKDSFTDEQYMLTYASTAEKNSLEKDANGKYKDEEAANKTIAAVKKRQYIYYKDNYKNDPTYSSNTDKVNVYLNYADGSKKVKVYTNMDASDVDGSDSQFMTSVPAAYNSYFTVNGSKRITTAFEANDLIHVSDEVTNNERYFTISVHMEPVNSNANTIVLNGAKGD